MSDNNSNLPKGKTYTDKKQMVVNIYANGVVCKILNKKTTIQKVAKNRNEMIFVRMAETKEDIEIPSCQFEVVKGKVCVTRIAFSNEGLEALYIAIKKYLEKDIIKDK